MKLFTRLLFLAGVLLAACACSKPDRLDQKFNAKSTLELASSRYEIMDGATPQELKDLESALKEIRISCASNRKPGAKETLDEMYLGRIDGRTLHEILVQGLEAQKEHFTVDRNDIAWLIDANKDLKTRPGDEESKAYLESQRRERERFKAELEKKIEEIDEKLVKLKASHPAKP